MTSPLDQAPRSLRAATVTMAAGTAALCLLAGLFIYGSFFLPSGPTGEGIGMVIALLPFTVVPAAVLLLLLGLVIWSVQRLRGAIPSPRDTFVLVSGLVALAALALAVVTLL